MPVIAQYAEEKQTILSFVAAGLGIALVPASYKDMNADGVKYLALTPKKHVEGLPPSARCGIRETTTLYVRSLLEILSDNIDELTREL